MTDDIFEKVVSYGNIIAAWETVQKKNTAGGIDEVSVSEYSIGVESRLKKLANNLHNGIWTPRPYLNVQIPKKEGSMRTIGLTSIEEKVVQTSIKLVIEPILEKTFYSSSYAYRPGKGHLKCIRAAAKLCKKHESGYYVRCDIDDYFGSINRDLLLKRLRVILPDQRLLDLIELCICIGGVDKSLTWKQPEKGIPQGAILSPMLANFYLSSFDQSMQDKSVAYLRYSDDFVIWADNRDRASEISMDAVVFLQSKLGLVLNSPPQVFSSSTPLEFLGLMISPIGISLSESKEKELKEQISRIKISNGVIDKQYLKNIDGIRRYYLQALPSVYKALFSGIFQDTIQIWESDGIQLSDKMINHIASILLGSYNNDPLASKTSTPTQVTMQKDVKKMIAMRKREYHKLEAENSELVISGPGYFIGAGERGLILRKNGQPLRIRSAAVKHITITSGGVGMSSNLVYYCRKKGITIDFFGEKCGHDASLLWPSFLHLDLWGSQALMDNNERFELAKCILIGKLKNQASLCKYFNKYHKHRGTAYAFEDYISNYSKVLTKVAELHVSDEYKKTLMAYEALGADYYWDYIRELLYDDDVEFYSRVQQGAKDIVNSMLNYGYSLLYPRIWQALLRNGLNPYIGFIHHADDNPHLVFDFIEIFRCQAVDRIVIGMIQKKVPCSVNSDGLLTEDTKSSFTERIMERIYRRERYRGESRTFADIIDLQAKELASSIRDGSKFKPYVAKW